MTVLNYLVLSVATFFLATDISFAQTYAIVPNDTVEVIGVMNDLETLTISQNNLSTDSLFLKWEKVSESVPANWEAAICDNSFCNATLVDSGMMDPVIPNDYGFLLLHITAHVNGGTAIIRYAVWDITNPSLRDTLTFIMTVNSASGLHSNEEANSFQISPNPAKGSLFVVTNLAKGFFFLITDLTGKEILKGITNEKAIILSTKNIRNGVYNFSIYEKNKMLNTKKFIVLN